MNLKISFEKKLEILKRMYCDEKDENIRKIILKEIKEIEELIRQQVNILCFVTLMIG